MTDHPTRRLPEHERPERTPETGPTRRLPEPDPGEPPLPPDRCLRCTGPMQRFPTATGEGDGWPLRV